MTASPVLWDTPGAALKRHAGVAVTVCLFACLALLPAQVGAAQDPSPSPSPEGLWKAYPLDPTAEPAPKQESSPAASASAGPAGAARTASDGGVSVFVVVLLALVAAGGMLTVAQIHGRRRRETEPAAAPVPLPSRSAAAGQAVPALWHGPSGRFNRAVSETTARTTTTATVAATQGPEGRDPRDALPRRDGPARPPAAGEPPPAPVAAPAPAGSPPDPRLTWAAEIEWRQIDGESRFCVIARGAGTVEIAQSPALDWPPEGPAAVQAVTDAADDLAATLVAAGWKPLPPGSAWYAKRFAWEPPVAEAATGGKGPKAVPNTPSGAKPVAPPRSPASGEAGTPDRVRSRRSRAKQLVVLGVLAVVGLIAALQFGGGSDERSAAKAGETIDVSVPLLVLVAVLMLVLIIRQIRNVLR